MTASSMGDEQSRRPLPMLIKSPAVLVAKKEEGANDLPQEEEEERRSPSHLIGKFGGLRRHLGVG